MFTTYINGKEERIYSAEELSYMITTSINWYKHRADVLQKENTSLYNNARDTIETQILEEDARLRAQLNLSIGEFNSIKEQEKYLVFKEKHKQCSSYPPNVYQYCYGPMRFTIVSCKTCLQHEDITDLEAQ